MNHAMLPSIGIVIASLLVGSIADSRLWADEPVSAEFAVLDKSFDGELELREFLSQSENDRSLVLRRQFYLLDIDENHRLSESEFQLSPKGKTLSAWNAFRYHDLNSNEKLSREEYLTAAGNSEERLPTARRNYQLVDFDESGELSYDEFCALPGLLPTRQRGAIPDPILDLLSQAMKRWVMLSSEADANQDGQLSETEWAIIKFPESLAPFQDLPFAAWDADGNGSVSDVEAEQLLAVSYGVRHPDGTLLHLPPGIRYYGSFLRPLDTNGDLLLSPQELVNGYWGGKEKGLVLFQELDADQNGQLTPAEIMATQPLTVDVLGGFLYVDKDFDGRISPEELIAHPNSGGSTPMGIAQTMAAFDDNRDGFLSLSEFQIAPGGYGYVTLRVHGKTDQNHDGILSWQEFYAEQRPVLLGLAWELFRRYDLDHDGKLSLDELEFRIDPSKVPLDVLFSAKDQNRDGQLILEELLSETQPAETDVAGQLRFAERSRYWQYWLNFADRNHDSVLSLNEYRAGSAQFPATVYSRFATWDKNGDGELQVDEYLAVANASDETLIHRNYRVIDFDRSGGLSFDEFRSYPGQLPASQRGDVPDIVQELAKQTLSHWVTLQSRADANRDEQLSQDEWAEVEFPSEWKPFQSLPWNNWDANGDGQITLSEAERFFAIAYGLQQRDGTTLRHSTGILCFSSFVRSADQDGDESLALDELASTYWGGREKGEALFQELDADKDGRLTTAEIMQTQPLTVDVLSAYLRVDTDQDGLASPAELLAYPSSGATPLGIAQTMAAFDQDRDGFLSYREYQLAPLGYGYVTLRVHGKSDQDHDGALSWQEFYAESSPVLLGLAWELFRRYDLDENGQLTLDELEFRIDPNKAPAETLFVARDHNRDRQLTIEELFLDRRPAETDVEGLVRFAERERYWRKWIAAADADQNQGLSLAEYQTGRSQFPEQNYSRFAAWDKNNDGKLTLLEYLAGTQPPDEAAPRRNFRVVDFDESGDLSFEEFCAFPGLLPPRQRGAIPDPIMDLLTQAVGLWETLKAGSDTNQDGLLSESEWATIKFPAVLTPFQDVPLGAWDADGNGLVSAEEAQHLFAVSYGVRHPDGTLLHLPSGIRSYGSFLRPLDTNGDLVLSPDELVNGYWGGKEKGLVLYQELDADQDGQLTPTEVMATQPLTVDVLGGLLHVDKDLDARISPEELLAHGNSGGSTPIGVAQTMAVFDENRDGFLSLKEFQLAPGGYGYVLLRVHGKTDQDHDGALSWGEFYAEKSPVLLGLAWELFRRYDQNDSGYLTLDELEFRIDPGKVPVEILFAARDINQNQQLEKEEFLAAVGNTPVTLRNFRLVDFNNDDALALDEYRSLPTTPAEQRGNIPDPVAELAAQALQNWKEATKYDSTADNRGVSSRGWPTSILKDALGPIGELRFSNWDANSDGYVDIQEAEELLAVAYGLQRVDGTPLRRPTGLVLFSTYLSQIDKNEDDLISPEEFIPQQWLGVQKATELYHQLDTDHDRQLSYADFWGTPATSIDTYSAFFTLDKDSNGLVSRQELLLSHSSGVTETRIEQMYSAFDENHDGQLSLREYRLLPFGMGYISYNVWGRQDLDNNGYLSWSEFFVDQQPALMGQAWELFRRLDRDLDDRLGFDEFEYRVNPAKVPVEMEFRLIDRNRDQRLDFAEIFKDPKPTSGNRTELQRYQVRMARAEDKFLYDDSNHDGSLNLEEFTNARQAVIEAAERHRRATGRLAPVETSDWFLPVFLVFDAIALAGAGWFVLRRRST